MNKIDWKSKLASRKFWAAIIAFVTTILTAFNVDQMTVTQVITVIGAISSLLVYILAEAAVDVARTKSAKALSIALQDEKKVA